MTVVCRAVFELTYFFAGVFETMWGKISVGWGLEKVVKAKLACFAKKLETELEIEDYHTQKK